MLKVFTFNFKNWTEIQNFFQIEIDKIEIIGRSFECGISSNESRKVSNKYSRRMLGDKYLGMLRWFLLRYGRWSKFRI